MTKTILTVFFLRHRVGFVRLPVLSRLQSRKQNGVKIWEKSKLVWMLLRKRE